MRALEAVFQQPARHPLRWKPKVFSARVLDEFLEYLDEIESSVPEDVRRLAKMLYGVVSEPEPGA